MDNPQHEVAGYFEATGGAIYAVLHQVPSPKACLLLIGPFALERSHSYIPLVRWARYLAERGIEVLRFDYRGVGESTGPFEKFTFSDWMEDVTLLSTWLKKRNPNASFFVHGVSLGAIFAGKAFAEGIGDGLLLWAPPANANTSLRSALMTMITLQKLTKNVEQRKPLSWHLAQMESGGFLEVNGYLWSADLWRDSFACQIPEALSTEEKAASTYNRPVRLVKLGLEAAPLTRGGLGGYEESNDLEWLYSANFGWLSSTMRMLQRRDS